MPVEQYLSLDCVPRKSEKTAIDIAELESDFTPTIAQSRPIIIYGA